MVIAQSPRNKLFFIAEKILIRNGFQNVKRWTEYKPHLVVEALEVYCSPLLISAKIEIIKSFLPGFTVTGNTNQSYILIQLT